MFLCSLSYVWLYVIFENKNCWDHHLLSPHVASPIQPPIEHSHMVTVALPLSSWWCSLRRKWVDCLCSCLCLLERAKDLEVPFHFLKTAKLPEPKRSVKEFVAVKLPRILPEIISNKVTRWLGKDRFIHVNHPTILSATCIYYSLVRRSHRSWQVWLHRLRPGCYTPKAHFYDVQCPKLYWN